MASCQYWHANYFYITMYVDIVETGSNYHKLDWSLWLHHRSLQVGSFSFNWWVNDQGGSVSHGAINTGSADYDDLLGSGSVWVSHTDGVEIGFGFSSDIVWRDVYAGGYLANYPSSSSTIWLPQLAVAPTPPNSVSVSGGSSGWLNKDSPLFNVSWSGASAGTYTITQYNIDVTKNGWGSIITPSYLQTSATSGSLSNVSAAGLGLSGGETINIRVAMMTTRGDWRRSCWRMRISGKRLPTSGSRC